MEGCPWDRFVWQRHDPHAFDQQRDRELRRARQGTRINAKTVAKLRTRASVEDLQTGPKAPRPSLLSDAEEAMIVAFRRHTLCCWTTASMPCSRRSCT